MSMWDYAYNPWGVKKIGGYLEKNLNRIGKQVGLGGALGSKIAPYGRSIGNAKVRMMKRLFNSRKRKRGSAGPAGRVSRFIRGGDVQRIRGGRRARTGSAARLGFVVKHEARGQNGDTHLVHVGHGPAASTLLYVMCACLWRKLYEKTGYRLNDWNAKPERTSDNILWKIQIDYYIGDNDTVKTLATGDGTSSPSTILNVADAHVTIASKLRGLMLDAIGDSLEKFHLSRIYIVDGASIGYQGLHAEVSCEETKFSFFTTSVLNMQNISTDAAGSGSTDTVTTNPLTGRMFKVPGNNVRCRGFPRNTAGVNLVGQYTDSEFGIIHGGGGFPNGADKVPNASEIAKVQKTMRLNLMPGQIKISKVSFKKTMYINSFLHKMNGYIRAATNANADSARKAIYMGHTKYYSFEKLLQHKTDLTTANVEIAWEINTVNGGYIHGEKKNVALPQVFVNSVQTAENLLTN